MSSLAFPFVSSEVETPRRHAPGRWASRLRSMQTGWEMTVGKSQNRSKRPAMQDRLKRLKFRAWHRGTREADYMIGGFFDRYSPGWRSEEHTSELQSLMRISYAVFCLQKKTRQKL